MLSDLRRLRETDHRKMVEMRTLKKEMEQPDKAVAPFVVYLIRTNGKDRVEFKTEKEAYKRYRKYADKKYFRQGMVNGVLFYRRNMDGTNTIIEAIESKSPSYNFTRFLGRFPKGYFENAENWKKEAFNSSK